MAPSIRTAPKPKPAPSKTRTVEPLPKGAKAQHADPKPAPGMKRTAEAPSRVATHTHTADDERRREAQKVATKEAVAARQAAEDKKLVDRLLDKEVLPTECKAAQLLGLNAQQLAQVAKAHGYKGYSGLRKDEMVVFLTRGGVKPAAEAGSTRQMREQVAAAKKAGLVSGPVSSLKVADLKAVVEQVAQGAKVTVTKPAPNAGTMDFNKALIRHASGKGYTEAATKRCKEMFGQKASISTLKSAQLAQLVKAMGLAK